jgi:methyl-accepting chemotaxis protein
MLRRKLLLNLGPVVVLLLATAVVAIWQLQGFLRDLNRINTDSWLVVDQVNELSIKINAIEVDLYELRLGKQRHLDNLIDEIQSAQQIVESLRGHVALHQPESEPYFSRISSEMPTFRQQVALLATAQDPGLAAQYNEVALGAAVSLRESTLPLSRFIRAQAHADQLSMLSWFRWFVLGLSIVFLLVINVSVIVLLRMGSMILQPVEKLLEATRQLRAERFEYRVTIDQNDEFDELGRAYNSLAEQLQRNEQKRLETLAQAAVTMNHELNNAISIIDLQLALLSRQNTAGSPSFAKCLRQIQDCLQRITQTVQSLKNIRRIVLTDYAPGTKMLDLQRSVEDVQGSENHVQEVLSDPIAASKAEV